MEEENVEEEEEKDQEEEEEQKEEEEEAGDTKQRIWFWNYSCHFQVLRDQLKCLKPALTTKKRFYMTCMLRIHVSVSSAASLLGCNLGSENNEVNCIHKPNL